MNKSKITLLLAVVAIISLLPYQINVTENKSEALEVVQGVSIVGQTLSIGSTQLDLTKRPTLFIDKNCSAPLAAYKDIADERKPALVVCGELGTLDLTGINYYQKEAQPNCPSIVCYEKGELCGYMYSASDNYLKNLKYPYLLGKGKLINPPISSGNHNAAQAGNQINGTVIQPGGIFSFYDYVTPSVEKGYQEGLTLYETEAGPQFEPDIGGGICKTATALNFAVQAAGLEVVEKHTHTEPVAYAAPGKDASVTRSGNWNYKFRNTYDHPIVVHITQKDDSMFVEIDEILPTGTV
jgi:hypothetical protein